MAAQPSDRRPCFEPLEPRLLLDAAPGAIEVFRTAPALFAENQGQWADEAVRFVHDGAGCDVAMTDAGPVFRLVREVPGTGAGEGGAADPLPPDPSGTEPAALEALQFSASFVGANAVTPVGRDPAETRFHYFVGDEAAWRSDVASYETVAWEGLYDGIDLFTWGQRDSLKYEFHVAPGADWAAIAVTYEGIEGLSIDDAGALHVALGDAWGEVVDDVPYIYQLIDGEEVEVAGAFALIDATTYAFEVTGAYDPSRELVIDPDLLWSTYLGGSDSDRGNGIAVDAAGNALVTGETESSGWVSGGWDTSLGGSYDGFVVKLSPSGGHLWSTYLGGSEDDLSRGIAVDMSGNALVTGETESSGWVSGGWDTSHGGGSDAFVVKLSPSGDHLWSTYLGGSEDDRGYGIAVDAAGNALVTGRTYSSGWVSGGWDTSHGGGWDAFVVRLSPSGDHLWSTYLGGGEWDFGFGIAVDMSGNALVTGYTFSSGWVSGGWDTSHGGSYDGFVVKLSPSGDHLWSSYLGGSGTDYGYGIAVDAAGNALVTGRTDSAGWVSGGWDTSLGGNYDGFVVKLSPSGDHLWSTYLGGSEHDYGKGIAVDASGNALVTGETGSSGWVSGGWDTSYGGDMDAFVVRLSPSGDHLWSTYLGGSNGDYGYGIAVDAAGNALVTGRTNSSGWVSGGWDTSYNGGGYDGFVAKLEPGAPLEVAGHAVCDGDAQRTIVRSVALSFSDDVSASLDAADLVLVNTSTGQTVNPVYMAIFWEPATNTATWLFPGLGGSLTDGLYTATLPAGSVQSAASLLSEDYVFTLHRLAGDADGDGTVTTADYFTMAAHWYDPATPGEGDFDGSGFVTTGDYFLLAGNWYVSVWDLGGGGGGVETTAPAGLVDEGAATGTAAPAARRAALAVSGARALPRGVRVELAARAARAAVRARRAARSDDGAEDDPSVLAALEPLAMA